MLGTGKNVGDLRRSNISLLLKLLYYEGAQSRKTLARKASLTPAAVTTLTTELLEKGYIVGSEITLKKGRVGRAEQFIDLNYRNLFILGLRIGRQSAEIRIFNLGLECIGRAEVEITACEDANPLFEMLCDKIAFLMVKNNISIRKSLGIGVTINGIVDPLGGVSLNSFGLIPDNTNIREQVEKRLHLPVSVNNNVRSMLMAESAINHHNQGVSHLFIKYGPGLGAAFSIAQQTYNGASYCALELGHVIINPEGELCRCGRHGCLETIISYKTILCEAEAMLDERTTPILYTQCQNRPITMDALAASIAGGDQPVIQLFREKFVLFTRCLESYVTILDPMTISVCSELFRHGPIREMFLELADTYAKSLEGRLVLNPESEKTEQVGAAALVIHSFLAGQIA